MIQNQSTLAKTVGLQQYKYNIVVKLVAFAFKAHPEEKLILTTTVELVRLVAFTSPHQN